MIGELDYCKRAIGIAYVRDRRPGLEMIITGASITHGGNRAFYRPSTDTIHMPPFEAFRDAESYYGRLAHETTPTGPCIPRAPEKSGIAGEREGGCVASFILCHRHACDDLFVRRTGR